MNLLQIKTIFSERLSGIYPKNEIDSIFYLTIEHLLKYNKLQLHSKLAIEIAAESEQKIFGILNRLEQYEPIQYIIGYTEFYNLRIFTDKRALIPRQETEFLVDTILKEITPEKRLKIIDLCTGTGCIAIALAANLKNCIITATDISEMALELAYMNAMENKLEVEFICDSLLKLVKKYGIYDIIVSNPPYIRMVEKRLMHQNVLQYEPELALFVADTDPLVFYKALADFGNKYLNQKGIIYCEINEAFGMATKEVFLNYGYNEPIVLKDLNGKDRFIKAMKS
jgi:release factor glutamine methyltransferase